MTREQNQINRSELVGVRLTPDEKLALERAATIAGESVVDYVRKAIAMRQQGMPDLPALNVSVGIYSMQVDYHHASMGYAPNSVTPEDFPSHVENRDDAK